MKYNILTLLLVLSIGLPIFFLTELYTEKRLKHKEIDDYKVIEIMKSYRAGRTLTWYKTFLLQKENPNNFKDKIYTLASYHINDSSINKGDTLIIETFNDDLINKGVHSKKCLYTVKLKNKFLKNRIKYPRECSYLYKGNFKNKKLP